MCVPHTSNTNWNKGNSWAACAVPGREMMHSDPTELQSPPAARMTNSLLISADTLHDTYVTHWDHSSYFIINYTLLSTTATSKALPQSLPSHGYITLNSLNCVVYLGPVCRWAVQFALDTTQVSSPPCPHMDDVWADRGCCRAETHTYFHYRLICQFFFQLMDSSFEQ